jgi:ATP adenylyltransferase/5',5'''-P-1,P-4-tetraphosphate phosphorylase II
MWELDNPKADTKKSQTLIDEAINNFDSLLEKVNAKKVENKRSHYKSVQSDLETVALKLIGKVNKL